MVINKKGDLRRTLMIFIVGLLLFGVFIAVLGLAETTEEEKARLEAELAQFEGQLLEIEVGKWVNISTESNPCQVSLIKYFNYNCDESIGYHTVCISNFSHYVSNSCVSMPEEALKVKLRILAIKNKLKILGEK